MGNFRGGMGLPLRNVVREKNAVGGGEAHVKKRSVGSEYFTDNWEALEKK